MIINVTTNTILAYDVKVCNSFWSRGRGLMFRRPLEEDEAFLFVHHRESVGATTIHMFFVFFDIGVIWLNADKRVVDTALAQSFRPYYAPSKPAQYFVECHPSALDHVNVGDQLSFEITSAD